MKAFRLLLLALDALVIASPVTKPPRTSEGQPQVVLSIALQPACRSLLEQTLQELSDPSSRRYGRYLGREEAKALLHPWRSSSEAVKKWLSAAKIPAGAILPDEQFLHVRAVAGQVEALLGVQYNETLGSQTIPVSWLPQTVQSHVMTVQYAPFIQRQRTAYPVDTSKASFANTSNTSFANESPNHAWTKSTADWEEECKSTITPACLKRLYHVDDYQAKHAHQNLFGIAGFDGQAAQYDQLSKFLREFAPYAANASFSVEPVAGGANPQSNDVPSGEANMDMQYAIAMAYNVPVRFYATGGANHDFIPDLDLPDNVTGSLEPFLELASHLLNLDDARLPTVVSISYGANEQLFPRPYAQQVCDMFGQLGTRGVSVVVSSGDMGPGASCEANDGTQTPKFIPSFPASCPYVTSVGATVGIAPETAADFSAGGFSEYFARPEWQDDAVEEYLQLLGEKWTGYYNPRGRGFPDVAAQGVNHSFWNHGEHDLFSGTSASAPVFASLIALLNDYRSRRGLPSMGFLNPWIYRVGKHAFTDITEAGSVGCLGQSYAGLASPVIPGAGWRAAPGWDPVTGWGTPLFDRLMDVACELEIGVLM